MGVLLAEASSRWRTQVANIEDNYIMIIPETAIVRAGINLGPLWTSTTGTMASWATMP